MSKSFTVEDVAELSGLTKATIVQKIRNKLLKAKRMRSYSIDGDQVREFLLKQATVKGGKRKTATEA